MMTHPNSCRFDPRIAATRKGWQVLKDAPVMGDGVQAPGYVTLCNVGWRSQREEYAVHFFNAQDGGFHGGYYTFDATEAKARYAERAARYTRHHLNAL